MKNRRGFTLIEMLLVIAIILVMTAGVSFAASQYTQKAYSISNAAAEHVSNKYDNAKSSVVALKDGAIDVTEPDVTEPDVTDPDVTEPDVTEPDVTVVLYTVTFNAMLGTPVPASISNLAADSLISAPTAPTRSGYTFKGWYKESTATTAWSFASDKVVSDTTLYAGWTSGATITYTVTFNSNGGSDVSSIRNITKDSKISTPTAPTKSGYTFGGWYKNADATQAWNFSSDKVTADITLYAKWTQIQTYTVTFNSNGGSDVSSLMNITKDSLISAPAAPTRSGYTFEGWYKNSNATSAWNFSSDKVASNITLYAKWNQTYTVTFNSNKGSAVAPITGIVYGTKISAPTSPTRSGYKFMGWRYLKNNGNMDYWYFNVYSVTRDITLYADWDKNW